jgi:hypothetical protein
MFSAFSPHAGPQTRLILRCNSRFSKLVTVRSPQTSEAAAFLDRLASWFGVPHVLLVLALVAAPTAAGAAISHRSLFACE